MGEAARVKTKYHMADWLGDSRIGQPLRAGTISCSGWMGIIAIRADHCIVLHLSIGRIIDDTHIKATTSSPQVMPLVQLCYCRPCDSRTRDDANLVRTGHCTCAGGQGPATRFFKGSNLEFSPARSTWFILPRTRPLTYAALKEHPQEPIFWGPTHSEYSQICKRFGGSAAGKPRVLLRTTADFMGVEDRHQGLYLGRRGRVDASRIRLIIHTVERKRDMYRSPLHDSTRA